MTMLLRRKFALAAVSVVAVAPVLTSCGFHYATDRPNVIANGGYAIQGNVHVLAARIVASAPGQGAFVATIANRPQASSSISLQNVSAPGLNASLSSPVQIGVGSAVNLAADNQGIPVTGDFQAGDAIPVTLTFSNGTVLKLSTIVVTACHEYASALPSASASDSGSSVHSHLGAPGSGASSATDSATASPVSASASPSSTSSPYSCDYPSVPPMTTGAK